MARTIPIPRSLSRTFSSAKKIIHEFAERSDMVYFGYVSQRSDEHQIIRGLTVSTKHTDDHYCIGTYDEYDVMFVERSDTLHSGKKHIWHIMAFDLKYASDIPHIFISSSSRDKGFHELLNIKYPHMQRISQGASVTYPITFLKDFELYTNPSDQIQTEQVVRPDTAEMIAAHFKGLVIEVTGSMLYIYSEKNHVSASLLDTMIQNGIWLSKQIDAQQKSAE